MVVSGCRCSLVLREPVRRRRCLFYGAGDLALANDVSWHPECMYWVEYGEVQD